VLKRHLLVVQALLVVLVTLVVALIAKDALNGMLRRPFLDPEKWQPLTCVDIKQVSHNTRRFRFALPHQEQVRGRTLFESCRVIWRGCVCPVSVSA
jgi:cytochrome-b5 reductase